MTHATIFEPWYIAGPGAIGLLIHSQLMDAYDQTQPTPIMIQRSHKPDYDHYQVITQGTPKTYPVHWFDQSQRIHNLIVTTKSYQVLDCLTQLTPFLADNANILLLHNGLGIQQQAAARWPAYHFYAGSTTEGAWKSDVNKVVHAGNGQTLIGSMGEANCPWWKDSVLSHAGFSWQKDILTQLHTKVAINAAINPLTVLFECQNEALIHDNKRIALLKDLCQETEIVLNSEGFFFDNLTNTVIDVAKKTGANYSSSYQDWKHNRQTELSSMNGYIQSLARKHNINTPIHDKVMAEVSLKALI